MENEKRLARSVQRTTALIAVLAARTLQLHQARYDAQFDFGKASRVAESARAYRQAATEVQKAVEDEVEANLVILREHLEHKPVSRTENDDEQRNKGQDI